MNGTRFEEKVISQGFEYYLKSSVPALELLFPIGYSLLSDLYAKII